MPDDARRAADRVPAAAGVRADLPELATAAMTDDVPIWCQQPGCRARVETWCPLCERFFCLEHDALTPVRRHDCLGGRSDAS
jgi:hypothetical protein